jgi:hypothetical protein
MFGCILPGQPILASSNFVLVGPNRWILGVDNVSEIRDVALYIEQPLSDPNFGLACYIAPPPFNDWRFLGAVSNSSYLSVLGMTDFSGPQEYFE